MKIYCEFLEECTAHGFEATLGRLTGGGAAATGDTHTHAHAEHAEHSPPRAPPPPTGRGKAVGRGKAAGPAGKPRARWAEGGDDEDLEGFIAEDGEAEVAGPVRKRGRAGSARP